TYSTVRDAGWVPSNDLAARRPEPVMTNATALLGVYWGCLTIGCRSAVRSGVFSLSVVSLAAHSPGCQLTGALTTASICRSVDVVNSAAFGESTTRISRAVGTVVPCDAVNWMCTAVICAWGGIPTF